MRNKENYQSLNNGNIFHINNLEEVFINNTIEKNSQNKYQKNRQYKKKMENKYQYYYGYYSYPYIKKNQDNINYIIYVKHDSKINKFHKRASNKMVRRKGKVNTKDILDDNFLNEYRYKNLFLPKNKCYKLYDYCWKVL